jgi:D-glycero-alpha-D-manno-heptose-7-phosphate kinase
MIIIAKSPLRVSFFGGGTDYPAYFERFDGCVLGSAIDKFIYTAALPMAGVAETRFRLTYRTVETVNQVSEIKHNVVRAVLQEFGYDAPLNIAILSDLPGGSGLGSSSSFTVGFIRLIDHFMGRQRTKLDLVREAVRIEHDVLRENVGIQDQTHAAFGGLNFYSFHKNQFSIKPVQMTTSNRNALNESLCLVYTGVQRSASATVDQQVTRTGEKKIDKELGHLVDLCHTAMSVLESSRDGVMTEMGRLLSEGWETKRSLSPLVSTPRIDEIYEAGMRAGAHGGKLCGAGGGGFFLFMAPPHVQETLRTLFGAANFIKIEMTDEGANIIKR